jgi:aldehyde dehydrogenase family 7 protein A1
VYNGKWGGAGDVLTSVNPSTNAPLARVRQATSADYEDCVAAMQAARKEWAEVSGAVCGGDLCNVGLLMKNGAQCR